MVSVGQAATSGRNDNSDCVTSFIPSAILGLKLVDVHIKI